MEEELKTEEQTNNRPWLYKKGQSGNPGGRPKGSKSMKQWVKDKLESMTDDEREDFLVGLNRETIWKLAEGNPATTTDITSGGQSFFSEEHKQKANEAIKAIIGSGDTE